LEALAFRFALGSATHKRKPIFLHHITLLCSIRARTARQPYQLTGGLLQGSLLGRGRGFCADLEIAAERLHGLSER
jgi:hypothetical protein